MLKKTLLATATAGLIAAGTMTTASAAPYHPSHGSPSIYFGFNFGPSMSPPPPVCRPVYKKVKWWDRYGHAHWRTVKVRYCPPPPPPPHYGYHPYGPNWGPGW